MMKTDDYNDQSVTEEKLKDGAITTRKIADGSVTKDKLDSSIRQEINDSVTASNEATEKAKEATAKADQATENAKQATAAATAAKEAADTATKLATNATTASVQATEQAKAATTKAEESAAKANEAAQKADDSREQTEQTLGTMQEVVDKVAIKDEEGALVETPFRYIQNEEFIFAKVDAEDKLLFGIHWDGTPKFGKTSAVEDRLQSQVTLLAERVATIMGDEDTTNVIDTMNELKKFFAEIENTQTLTSILANLNRLNTKFGEDIKKLQDTKVDKEEGKSLIEDEVKECFRVIENEEFIIAIVDAENKALFGFYRATGKPYYPLNEMYHVEQNEEFFAVWLDAADHVLLGIRRDGQIIGEIHAVNALKQVISQLQADLASLQEKVGTIDTNLKELLDVFSLQENPEYLAVEQDAEGKVISTTNADGSHYIHKVKSETIPEEFEHIEDPEGRMEVTTDAEDKILGYRDAEGTRHEKNLHVEELSLDNFDASEQAVDKFNSIIKKPWKTTDWSNETDIHLPLPKFAIFNVICSQELSKIDHKVGMEGFVKGLNCELPAKIQFSDLSGNYFEKDIIFSAQGSSSMNFKIKNHAIDFADGSSIKFGDWIPMDSFHVKKYFIDVFRGQCVVAYHLAEQIMQTRSWSERRGFSYLDSSSETNGDSLPSNDFNTEALCHPDGFPVEMYYNGEYVGLYAWTLKKHRSNYNMKKGENTKIIIDGVSGSLWTGAIEWKNFELKNPKKLYYTDYDSLDETDTIIGSRKYLSAKHAIDKGYITKYKEVYGKKYYEYDGDYADEICGEESVDNGVSKAIKDYILNLHNFSKTSKDEFAESFNVPLLIDYLLFSQFTYNRDGMGNNVVWTSYDLKKLCPNYYDLDCIFGSDWSGYYFENSESTDLSIQTTYPMHVIKTLYIDELKERYKELRDAGIFTSANVVRLYTEWVNAIGYDRLLKEIDKMKELGVDIPSHSDTFCNSIGRIEKWVNKKLVFLDTLYNYK